MDKKALYNLSYGVFMLSTKYEDKINGCITNTCIQVANNPVRVAVSVLNTNYPCELMKKSGIFALSLLDKTCTFETIKHFGFQSGRNVNKFEKISFPVDDNGSQYLAWQTCSMLSCKIISSQDLESHTLFIAEVVDSKVLSENQPLTYDYYQSNIKPKPEEKRNVKKIVGWRCKICNYVYEGSELPKDFTCPICGHDVEDFEPIYE